MEPNTERFISGCLFPFVSAKESPPRAGPVGVSFICVPRPYLYRDRSQEVPEE